MKYECCVTLRPSCYRNPVPAQVRLLRDIVMDVFRDTQFSACIELTRECNPHAHILVEFPDHKYRCKIMNRFRSQRLAGRHPASQVIDEPKYTEYMRKDLEVLRQIGIDPVINDWFNIFADRDHLYRFLPEVP